MSLTLIHQIMKALRPDRPLPDRMVLAYTALQVIENAAQELAFLDPLDPPPCWATVQKHAARARGELACAPSMHWPLTSPPPTVAFAIDDVATVTAVLIDLSEDVVLLLLEAAGCSEDRRDEPSCLRAVHHTSELTTALRRSHEVQSSTEPI